MNARPEIVSKGDVFHEAGNRVTHHYHYIIEEISVTEGASCLNDKTFLGFIGAVADIIG